ncbi:MAG TPA: hypothetical protein VHZ07_18155 [Bryobacteraceae bacterium]|jgi:hypothetical protein|nr:hypothetical protein [Bryobacteraceae bacterium]
MSTAAMNDLQAPSACLPPWLENPYRLVSLWDMNKFNADKFCRCSGLIGQAIVALRSGQSLEEQNVGMLFTQLEELRTHCEELGLFVTLAQINRVTDWGRSGLADSRPAQYCSELGEVMTRLSDELGCHEFLHIPSEKRRFYNEIIEPYLHPGKKTGNFIANVAAILGF